ncbi:cache domain-containing protein [Marinilactibacillus sp. XAAS-LB27]|uniref:cache domain-containing protein n=1 Tax=Marinilactibacillus sp. XAAS-LB27 TaxID=3114538 RepID=UPI002E18B32D|nr:cache domain-containing protein [Marinilactibacillus sp. XAAS-LB27]
MMFKHNLQSEKKTLLTKSKKVHKTKEKRKKSIRSRLIILFSLLVIVPVVLSSFVLYADMRGAVEYRVKREQKEATTKIVDLLYDAGNEAKTTLLSISETEEINNLDQSEAVEQLNQSFSLLKQSLKYVSDVFIYSPGTNNIGTLSEENLYLSANAWYEGARNSNEDFYLSDTYEDNETGNETMAVIMQVPGQDQVIGVTLNLEKISTYVSDKKIGQTGYPLVISETGFSQLSQEDTDLSEDTLFTDATENSGELLSNLNNQTYPIYYERVNNLNMIVYGVIGSDEMKTENNMFLQKLTIILISALIIAVGIGYLVSEYIVTIAKTIQEALFRLENGDMTARIYSFNFYPFKNFNKKNKNKRVNRSEKKPTLDPNGHELQQIAISFNQAARSFNRMIEIVINKADEVSTLS